jgi:EpsI family protein
MNPALRYWAPAVLLSAGAMLTTLGVKSQRSMALRTPLDSTVPLVIAGLAGETRQMSAAEARVAGVSSYLLRLYADSVPGDSGATTRDAFMLYVGYYEQQTQGKTIHSPKNCLPGAGWEPLTSSVASIATDEGPVAVNRWLIQNGSQRALVFYWYQGRGRVAANEYAVKWHLLRDAALRRRSDEALVRIVVPVTTSEADAQALAERVARQVVPAVRSALPA